MKRIVMLNGPPGCGKDTLVSLITPYLKFAHAKVSAPLKRAAAGMLDITLSGVEDFKDEPVRVLQRAGTMTTDEQDTLREFQIAFFNFLAERYGDDILGRTFCNEIKNNASPLIINSDTGKLVEFKRIVNYFGVKQCLLIRIHRDGCTFENDIREYMPDGICASVDLHNTRDLHFLTAAGLRLITQQFPDIKLEKEITWVKVR